MTGGPAAADVLVVTRADDVHAFGIGDALRRRHVGVSIVEVDRLPGGGALTWGLDPGSVPGSLEDANGNDVLVRDAAVVWWRRFGGRPHVPDHVDPAAHELVQRDCAASLLGLFTTDFTGTFVSDPHATRIAENKLVQLRAASRAGLTVPRTLVSAEPHVVREFCESLDWRVVVKPVTGAGPRQPIMTGRVTPDLLEPAAIRLCPAMYQELVDGPVHLRVNLFGARDHTARLVSSRLDWRYPLDCEASPHELEPETAARLRAVLDDLNLRMGIFDLKLTPSGEVVWLEVNPQGQFLWLEGMCGMPLADHFADFLAEEVAAARR